MCQMLSFVELWEWFNNSETWEGRYGLLSLLAEHLSLTISSIFFGALLALPIGVLIGHRGKGQVLVIGMSSFARAVPTMGLLFALVMLFGVNYRDVALVVALAAIAVPPILAGAYSGISTIATGIKTSAVAQGMRPAQLIWHVELPLAASSIIGGFRIAFIQVVSTVVLAPLVGLGGLGFGIIQGLALRDFTQVTATALVIVVITLTGNALIGMAQNKSRVSIEVHHKTGKNK